MNEFIATQSSDRSVHVYSVSSKQGVIEVHSVGKNSRVAVRSVRNPNMGRAGSAGAGSNDKSHTSGSMGPVPTRPRHVRRDSATSETESVMTSASEFREEAFRTSHIAPGPLTPSASVASTPSIATASANAMFPPPPVSHDRGEERGRAPSSRRSSFSSQAPGSPATTYSNRIGRSPSPMPPLPAISAPSLANVRLYGEESFTNFFRRLTFSPDGGLLLTPAGHFEDPSLGTGFASKAKEGENGNNTGTVKPSPGKPTTTSGNGNPNFEVDPTSASSVYIYSRMNFSKPPIGQIPGFKKASVAVRFSPVLYELRGLPHNADTKTSEEASHSDGKGKEPVRILVEPGREESVTVDLTGSSQNPAAPPRISTSLLEVPSAASSPVKSPVSATASIAAAIRGRSPTPQSQTPAQTPTQPHLAPSRSQSAHATAGSPSGPPSVFALPYRMLFAVATMDTITVHDTQQAGPICLFTKLHYDEFTDMTW
jgi:chromatin assembly factor 1 subunit B